MSKILSPFWAKLLSYNLVIALPLAINATTLAQITNSPKSDISPVDDTAKQPSNLKVTLDKLRGTWEGQDANSSKLNLTFTTDGKLIISSKGTDGKLKSFSVTYKINPTPKPMYMDIVLSQIPKPVLTIFNFTDDDKLKIQLDGTNPGLPRPTDFSDSVSLFNKKVPAATGNPKSEKPSF